MQGTLIDISERWRTRQDLIAERHLLRTLMDHVPDAIYFKDAQSQFTRINKAMAEHSGLGEPAHAIGRTDFDFFTPEHAQQAMADEAEVMKTGQPIIGKEEKETWPDGRIGWVVTSKLPLRNAEGKIVGTFGISRDITRRKLAEDALRESEERHRIISKLTSDYVYSVRFDQPAPGEDEGPEALLTYQGFTTEWVTESFQRVTGYTIEEVDARGGWRPASAPRRRCRSASLRSVNFSRGQRGEAEYRIITKAGEVRWLHDFCQPVWDSEQRRTVRVCRRRAGHHRTQNRGGSLARKRSALPRALREQRPSAWASPTFKATCIAFNDAMLKPGGYTREDIVGPLAMSAALYWDAHDRDEVLALAGQHGSFAPPGGPLQGQGRHPLHHPARFDRRSRSRASPAAGDGRGHHRAQAARRAAPAGAEDGGRRPAGRRRRPRLQQPAHRHPRQRLAAAGRRARPTSPTATCCRDIEKRRRARRRADPAAARLLPPDRCCAWSRQPQRRHRRRPSPSCAGPSTRASPSRSRPTPDLWPVQADPGQINQVLMNLCLNARDAMPEGGRLTLETANVVLDDDHAPAAPRGPARRVRPPARQRHRPRHPAGDPPAHLRAVLHHQGAGQGHRAWAWPWSSASSSSTRAGSSATARSARAPRFDIYLPRASDAGAASCRRQPAAPRPAAAARPILLVDDEAMIRNLGRTILQRYGYHVLLAEDGQEALEIYRREQSSIDLVILDLTMPRLSGRDTLRQLLQIDPDVRVLFSSGYSAEQITATDGKACWASSTSRIARRNWRSASARCWTRCGSRWGEVVD